MSAKWKRMLWFTGWSACAVLLMGATLLERFDEMPQSEQEDLLELIREAEVGQLPALLGAHGAVPVKQATPSPPQESGLEIVGIYPPPDVRIKDELIFYFSEPLAPEAHDALLRCWPPVPGRLEIQENMLRFTSPLLEAVTDNINAHTLFIEISPDVRSVTGKGVADESRRHFFCLPELDIDGVRVEDVSEDSVRLLVNFTRRLCAVPGAHLVSVQDGAGHTVEDIDVGQAHAARIHVTLPHDTLLPITIAIEAGLQWGVPGPSVFSMAGIKEICDRPPLTAGPLAHRFPHTLYLASPQTHYDIGEQPVIRVSFDSPIHAHWLEYLATVTHGTTGAPLSFSVVAESEGTVLLLLDTSSEESAPLKVKLSISPFFSSLDLHRPLGRRFERLLEAPMRPLELQYQYWDDQDIEGYVLNLNFNAAVDSDEIQQHLEIIPPVNDIEVVETRRGSRVGLRADWQSEADYVLRLRSGLMNISRDMGLKEDLEIALEESPLREGAVFDTPNLFYFPRRDAAAPGVKARNISHAEVEVGQIFPSNIPVFVRDLTRGGPSPFHLQEYARALGTITVDFSDARDALLTGSVNLDALLPKNRRGIFLLAVKPTYAWQDTTRVVVYTDIGALAHWTNNELVLFAHDLFTLAPLEQAQVRVFSHKFQLMGMAHTDAEGIARFMSFDGALGEPALAVIEKGEDYAFLDLREEQKSSASFTASMPTYDRDGYDASLYLDRNLYRPGETLHIRWIARTRYVDALHGVPLQLRIANPQGRWIYEAPAALSDFGAGGLSFQSERSHPTGRYAIELRVPEAAQPIGQASFNLEEFVPNRMRATAKIDRERLAQGDVATVTVLAENLYGGVASGRKTEARVFLRPTVYESDAWPGYYFGNEDSLEEELFPLGDSVTDEAGRSSFEYVFKPGPEVSMPVEAVVGVRVLEVGGRAVSDTTTALGLADGVLLGVVGAPRPEQELIEVHVAAVNAADDTPADLDSVQITLDRQEWNFHMRRFQQRNEPRWAKAFTPVRTYEVALSEGRGTLKLPYPEYGEYRVRVHSEKTRMYSAIMFNRWWQRLEFVSESRPELVRLTTNQERYRAGDSLTLRIESPYDGRAFVVIQGENMKEQRVVPVVDSEGLATFTVSHDWFPNVWIQGTVVRDTDRPDGARYPYSSFSMVNVPLDNTDRRIEMKFLDAPEEIRPAEPFTITLETRDQDHVPVVAEVTVAVVDEGIHSILGYELPDPYGWFQRSRQFKLQRGHYYDQVFFDAGAPAIGGDMMRRLGITSQVDENWIKPVALWSGVVRTDDQGIATLTFDVPEFIGQLRVSAVAVNERAVGATEVRVFARRPHILRTGMPRFALAGDRFECTATAVNMTDAPATAVIQWSTAGAISGAGEKRLDVPAHDDRSVRVPVVAAAIPGQGAIEWTMTVYNADGDALEKLHEEALLPVRNPAAYETDTEIVTLMPGESRVMKNTRFAVDPGFEAQIRVTGDPMWQLAPGLKYLLRFPHGCVEQVTSRAMPLYLLRNYARLYGNAFEEGAEAARLAGTVDSYIRQSIDRLLAMQTVEGGLSAWPGASQAYPYGSIYALHFLTLIRRDHAFAVYDDVFRALQQYARSIMFDDSQMTLSQYYLRAYACYVLALDGDLDAIEFVPRLDTIPVPQSARYLLAAAKAMHTQDVDVVSTYLDTAPVIKWRERQGAGALHSPIRADAVRLLALTHVKAPPEQMQPLVALLTEYLTKPRNFTTQEAGLVVTALGMYLESFHEQDAEVAASIGHDNGDDIIRGLEVFEKVVSAKEPRFEISNTGSAPVFVHLSMGGIPLRPRAVEVAEALRLRRVWLHEDGTPVLGNTFRHGGQYLVELVIEPERKVENLLITDLLPAGLEIANPRLEVDAQPGMSHRDPDRFITTPAHLEIRDDRIAFALDELDAQEYFFRYLVRAVTPGSFQAPALHGECMYLPMVRAATVSEEIVVE